MGERTPTYRPLVFVFDDHVAALDEGRLALASRLVLPRLIGRALTALGRILILRASDMS